MTSGAPQLGVDRRLRILVPLDLSETSLRGLDHALAWALRAPCEIHLLHVIEGAFAHATPGVLAHDLGELARVAHDELLLADPAAVTVVERHVASGSPAAVIPELARRLGVDLVLLAARGAAPSGGVIDEVARRVAVQRAAAGPRPPRIEPPRWRRIVCATDFSPCASRAAAVAARLAGPLGLELLLLHVTPAPEDEAAATEALRGWARRVEARSAIRPSTAVVVGEAAAEIARHGRPGLDVLVVGTIGVTPIAGRAVGSVAERVILGTPCPVITVPPSWLGRSRRRPGGSDRPREAAPHVLELSGRDVPSEETRDGVDGLARERDRGAGRELASHAAHELVEPPEAQRLARRGPPLEVQAADQHRHLRRELGRLDGG
jgi:nucleotide-binding universal stress UspA family protein